MSMFKHGLIFSALLTVWTAFSAVLEADAAELQPVPPRFRKVLVLFSADMAKEDRDAFLGGLEDVRARHQKEYYEIVRKWRESAPGKQEKEPTEQEKAFDEGAGLPYASQHDFERSFYHNPYFLDVVDTQMIRTDAENPSFDDDPGSTTPRLVDLESLPRFDSLNDPFEALIVVASDSIAADLSRMIRNGFLGSMSDKMVVLLAGVSSFDESVRQPQTKGNMIEPAKAPYAFAIRHAVDPWPNTDLALSVFPRTKKVILLAPDKVWNEEWETACRAKIGPGKTLTTVLMPELRKEDMTEADIKALKDKFAASAKAEVQPDTVIISLSSIETGQDPASWLPDKFDACPVFADTIPSCTSSVGGFCRSMWNLGEQTADLLEQLGGDSLLSNKLPPVIVEDDGLLLNESARKRYGLKVSDFPGAVAVKPASAGKAPVRRQERTWTRKRIALLLAANAAVLAGLFAFTLISLRAARRKRQIFEMVYGALPVRVLVTDRDGRIIERHASYGEVEQKGEFPWNNIRDVPWLKPLNALDLVQSVFDSGKTIVREMEIDGERRIVVLSSTQSDVLGRPAVITVSCSSPERD